MNKKKIIQVIFIFAIIFFSHFIIFLAFYPGICTYDLNAQIAQYVEHDFCTSHPLLHTLFIGFFHDLFASDQYNNNINLGYALATILQLLIVDSAMTYSVMYIHTIFKKKWISICAIAFYAVFPINSLLAISHTKDTLFAAFGLVFFIDTIRLFSEQLPTRKNLFYTRASINGMLMTMMRNNATYAIGGTLIFLLFLSFLFIIKANKLKISSVHKCDCKALNRYIILLFIIIILSLTGNKILVKTTHATPGSIKEMMSIPAQIIGRIYNTVATDSEKDIILQYIPNTEEYNYYLSDPMKHYLPFEIWESKCKHFLLDSTKLALHHPIVTLEAIWLNIQGFIDPFHQPYSSDRYYLAYTSYRGDATLNSKLPVLCSLYTKLFSSTSEYCHTPIVIPFNIGIYIWLCIIAFIISIRNGLSIKACNPYLFPIFYLCTLLLGPGAITRYGYIYVLISPIAICQISQHIRTTNPTLSHNSSLPDQQTP